MSTAHLNLGRAVHPRPHILAVADWSVDPRTVAQHLERASEAGNAVFRLLVPARLPALEWIGDPYASRPCAERQLAQLVRQLRAFDVDVDDGRVADPERVSAHPCLA